MTVDLERDDAAPALEERQRERSEAGADLEHAVARVDSGEADDAPRRVGVGEEVLAQRLARAQVVAREQLADGGGGEQGHQGANLSP